jgi:hypothetical protein
MYGLAKYVTAYVKPLVMNSQPHYTLTLYIYNYNCGKEQLVRLTLFVHVCYIVALYASLRLFMYGTCD